MPNLVVDTSTSFLYFAFADSASSLCEQRLVSIDRQSDLWLSLAVKPYIKELKSNSASVYIGEGPGSFTGLRVAYAYFKMAAQLYDMKFHFFNSLRLWHNAFALTQNDYLLVQNNSYLYFGFHYPSQTTQLWQKHQIDSLNFRQQLQKDFSNVKSICVFADAFVQKQNILENNIESYTKNNFSILFSKQIKTENIYNRLFSDHINFSRQADILQEAPHYGNEIVFATQKNLDVRQSHPSD